MREPEIAKKAAGRAVGEEEGSVMGKYDRLREHMAALGYDVAHLTDEELEEGLRRTNEAVQRAALSMAQAAQALASLGEAASTAGVSLGRLARPRYYILEGKEPAPTEDVNAWGHWFETANRRVRLTRVGPYLVSTVFLGMDHNFMGGRPILFETMVYCEIPSESLGTSWTDHQARCSVAPGVPLRGNPGLPPTSPCAVIDHGQA